MYIKWCDEEVFVVLDNAIDVDQPHYEALVAAGYVLHDPDHKVRLAVWITRVVIEYVNGTRGFVVLVMVG